MSDIAIQDLTHIYSAGTPFERTALEKINLTIPQGQFVGVIGHTGSGKSTFVQHLNALLSPTQGKVFFGDMDINKDKFSRREIKWKVGLVFQYPEYQLFEETVYKDIAFGPKNMKLSETEIDERVREAAAFTGVDEALFEASPLELSGGQKRRVAIAGVIAMRPEVLVLDEPTAGLDPIGCEQIMGNICNYHAKTGATVLVVSHNMDEVARFAQRLIVFNRGSIAFDGSPEEVFCHSDELVDIGLSIPRAAELARELRKQGMNIPASVYTHEQLLSAVLRAKGVAEC